MKLILILSQCMDRDETFILPIASVSGLVLDVQSCFPFHADIFSQELGDGPPNSSSRILCPLITDSVLLFVCLLPSHYYFFIAVFTSLLQLPTN